MFFIAAAGLLSAQGVVAEGTTPRKSAAEYPVQGRMPDAEFGVEYTVRSFGDNRTMYLAEGFLAVDVAIFPLTKQRVKLDRTNFDLRVNGKVVHAAEASQVASNLRFSDYRNQPIGGMSTGGGDSQPRSPRFPGDPRAGRQPPVVQSPHPTNQEALDPPSLALKVALPAPIDSLYPVSGFVYFPFDGKMKNIKTVDLLIVRDSGTLELRLK